MKMLLTAGVIALTIAFTAGTAQAGHYHHKRGYHHGYHGYHHGHHYDGDALLIGAGIVAGALLLTRLFTPRHYSPAPVYVAPPRPRYCVQDRVYRHLPGGRIQWGTRTTCYH